MSLLLKRSLCSALLNEAWEENIEIWVEVIFGVIKIEEKGVSK